LESQKSRLQLKPPPAEQEDSFDQEKLYFVDPANAKQEDVASW
jgi:hypothetical protein